MKLIQRSSKCGKDVAKAGWPIASEEYLISFAARQRVSFCTQTIIFNIYGDANAQTVAHGVIQHAHPSHPATQPLPRLGKAHSDH